MEFYTLIFVGALCYFFYYLGKRAEKHEKKDTIQRKTQKKYYNVTQYKY